MSLGRVLAFVNRSHAPLHPRNVISAGDRWTLEALRLFVSYIYPAETYEDATELGDPYFSVISRVCEIHISYNTVAQEWRAMDWGADIALGRGPYASGAIRGAIMTIQKHRNRAAEATLAALADVEDRSHGSVSA